MFTFINKTQKNNVKFMLLMSGCPELYNVQLREKCILKKYFHIQNGKKL